MKIAIVSLGCPKNQVDADVFCRSLLEAGHETVPEISQADIVIVNTCGFIEDAKMEAIENILDVCKYREENPDLKVIVTGCLAERYKSEVAKELPEIDAVVGIGANKDLPKIVEQVSIAQPGPVLECYGAKGNLAISGRRVISTPAHYAWLKIAEGCSNACAYCAIPSIRGPFRSRPPDECVAEARWLAGQGVREVVLVAQDVTAFGEDRGENQLVPLLKELEKIEGLHWIRLLYAYPERVTENLLDIMARSEKILSYLDLPIQHCSDGVLRAMGRKGTNERIRRTVANIRDRLPEVTLRTTLIAGYPGETEEQFEELYNFVQEMRFDRLGCFAYSPEEGTRAAQLPGLLPEEDRKKRAEIIMQAQSEILLEKQLASVGAVQEVLCDEFSWQEGAWLCRARSDAPEIDTNIFVPSEFPMTPGEFYSVQITGAELFDRQAILL